MFLDETKKKKKNEKQFSIKKEECSYQRRKIIKLESCGENIVTLNMSL